MTTAAARLRSAQRSWAAVAAPFRRNRGVPWGAIAVIFALVIIFPLLFDPASDKIDAGTTALAYVVMALGLNIVVGFAGLLDLGYVAFYALGALTIGWLGSGFAYQINHQKGVKTTDPKQVRNGRGIAMSFRAKGTEAIPLTKEKAIRVLKKDPYIEVAPSA